MVERGARGKQPRQGRYYKQRYDQRQLQSYRNYLTGQYRMKPVTNEEKLKYKQGLKAHCLATMRDRIQTAREAMEAAQESANNEDKSSAGDKYETGRAMSQIDRDRSAGQMDDAVQDMVKLQSIDTDRLYTQVNNGAVIRCGDGVYFIAAGLGVLIFEEDRVITLSPQAPLSNALRGRVKDDEVTFNSKVFSLTEVF